MTAALILTSCLALVTAAVAVVMAVRARRLRAMIEHGAAAAAVARLAIDGMPRPAGGWDAGNRFHANPALCALTGHAPTDFDDLLAGFAPDQAVRITQHLERLFDGGADWALPVTFHDRDMVLRAAKGPDAETIMYVLWLEDRPALLEPEPQPSMPAPPTPEPDRHPAALLVDIMPQPSWIRDGGGTLVWVNAAYCRAVVADRATILDTGIELAPGVPDLAHRARASGQAASAELHVVMAGSRCLIQVTEWPPVPPGADGETEPLSVGQAVDVTQLETVRDELKGHIDAHGRVLEQLKSAIAIFGADKRLTFYNQAHVSLWGFDETWLDSRPGYDEVLEDLRLRRKSPEQANFLSYKKAQLARFTDLLAPMEELLHLPDGTTIRQVVTPHPFGGLLFVTEDVTSSLALEASYNTLIEVQRESLNNLAEGVAVYGSDGRLRLWNPAFRTIWHLDADELEGRPHVSKLIDRMRRLHGDGAPDEDGPDTLIKLALARDGHASRTRLTDGTVLYVRSVPLPDGGVMTTYLDITDSANVEQALRDSNMALETADRLKSEFIANVSYQLRTPLNAIMGFAEILDNRYFGELNARQAEYTVSIIDASRRLLALINDILDLATIEAGYLELERRQVPVASLLRDSYDLTFEWAGKQNLKMRLSAPDGLGSVAVDERRIKQALFNLISNAIRYTPAGGTITLAAERDERGVRLIVSDTGIGIPDHERDRVFGRFERAHPKDRRSGAGLGLALVKSLVEIHGGSVKLVSRAGEGTTVTCEIPLTPPGGEFTPLPPPDPGVAVALPTPRDR